MNKQALLQAADELEAAIAAGVANRFEDYFLAEVNSTRYS
jgi:hypothetical protein